MTVDPREGLDPDGYLVTGVELANVRPPYDEVLADAATTLRTELGDDLLGLYVYGSVATGQAKPPLSDLDLLALVTDESARSRCEGIAAQLTARHREVVRDVGIGAELPSELDEPTDTGAANRCFLKHYCVSVAGVDHRTGLPRCRPSHTLAREFIGDLDDYLACARKRLAAASTDADLEQLAGGVARKLGRTAAVLYSVLDGGWATASSVGHELVAARHPAYAAEAGAAAQWTSYPLPPDDAARVARAEIARVLDRLGVLLAADKARHLDHTAPT